MSCTSKGGLTSSIIVPIGNFSGTTASIPTPFPLRTPFPTSFTVLRGPFPKGNFISIDFSRLAKGGLVAREVTNEEEAKWFRSVSSRTSDF